MKGKSLQVGATFYPREDTPVGDEWCGTYQGLKTYEYEGQPKQAAMFEREDGLVQCSAGQLVKVFAPAMTVGRKYWVKYEGKKQIKKNQAASHQFSVAEDDGNG